MINFTRSFDLAWERMVAILFRPFDIGKWFVIGFCAFLAGLPAGGNGFLSSFPPGSFHHDDFSNSYTTNLRQLNMSAWNWATAFTASASIFIILIFLAFVLGFVALLYWLGANGQFLFLDNVVRNRAAVAWPWSTYGRLANSLFGFNLLYFVLMLVVIGVLCIPALFLWMPLFHHHRWPQGGEIPFFVLYSLVYFAITLTAGTLFFLFRELGVPLMFRHGWSALAAFRETWNLIKRHPGSIVLFVLLRIALFLALLVLSLVGCCCFCLSIFPCFGQILLSYILTILLLPGILYIKCFSLDVLAQFGPEYDVWTVDVPPAASLPPAPIPPPPPV